MCFIFVGGCHVFFSFCLLWLCVPLLLLQLCFVIVVGVAIFVVTIVATVVFVVLLLLLFAATFVVYRFLLSQGCRPGLKGTLEQKHNTKTKT